MLGSGIYAIAMIVFGATCLLNRSMLVGLEPMSATFPAYGLIASVTGAILVVCGLGILLRRRVAIAAAALGAMLTAWLLLLHIPTLVMHPGNGGAWTTASELLAIAATAWLILATFAREHRCKPVGLYAPLGTVSRIAFGVAQPIYGIQHFHYATLVAGMIPGWIPGKLFFAYAVGVAFCAAGASIMTGVLARVAAQLLGLMFAIWVIVLHIPRVANANNENEWISMTTALALCGGAWTVAAFIDRKADPIGT